jgi:hypothetical protein
MTLLGLSTLLTGMNGHTQVKGMDHIQGEWGSGGGNALVCFIQEDVQLGNSTLNFKEWIKNNDNTIPDALLPFIESIEMYDLYEAKLERGISREKTQIIEIGETEDFYAYFDRLGNRFKNRVPGMIEILNNGKALIPDNNIMFYDNPVIYQNDLGSVSIPSRKCIISTMAAQVNFNDYYQVHIDKRLFFHRKHSRMSQATLLLHELVYAEGRESFKHTDSGSTRQIVGQMISYHPLYTEGSISKSLYTLDFSYRKREGAGQNENWYNNSYPFVVYKGITDYLLSNEKWDYDIFVNGEITGLEKRIRKKCFENFGGNFGCDTVVDETRVYDLVMILKYGANILQSSEWKKIHDEFYRVYKIHIQDELTRSLDTALLRFNEIIDQDSSVNSDAKYMLKKSFEYNSSWARIAYSDPLEVEKLIVSGDRRGYFGNPAIIFSVFDVIMSGDGRRYENFNLDNIIPIK